jgi:hypothetical protein
VFPNLSVSQLLSGLAADATTIGFDLPGSAYDRLHQFIEARNVLPNDKQGRLKVIAVLLLASRLVQQQLGSLGPVASFANDIANDGVREEAKRILEAAQRQSPQSTSTMHALWAMDEGSRTNLLNQFRSMSATEQQEMREHLMRSSVEELVGLSSLSPEDAATVLAMVRPITKPRTSMLNTLAENLFPWTRTQQH